ncbi:hypothetical protein KP509_1Z112200 [Ceratopteris richardii]|nr:hypothetical protein KP509_1Z112200 [Ceratopteris richardii]
MDLSEDLDSDYDFRQVASISEWMAKKLQIYLKRNIQLASNEIMLSTMATLGSFERRLRLRIIHCEDRIERLKDLLHDVREEILQLVEKRGIKQESLISGILEDVGEMNEWFYKFLPKGVCAEYSFHKNSIFGNEEHGINEKLRKKTEANVSKSNRQFPGIQNNSSLQLSSSSIHVRPFCAHEQSCNSMLETRNSTEKLSGNSLLPCKILSKRITDDCKTVCHKGVQEKYTNPICKQTQTSSRPDKVHVAENHVCNLRAEKSGPKLLQMFAHKSVHTKNIQKDNPTSSLSIIKEAHVMQDIDGNRTFLERQPLSFDFEQRKNRKCRRHYLTDHETERLVIAIEKFGVGRWKDIKETYFSLENNISASTLKEKWRSLLHSAKLTAGKRRSLKPSGKLTKHILELDERDRRSCSSRK